MSPNSKVGDILLLVLADGVGFGVGVALFHALSCEPVDGF